MAGYVSLLRPNFKVFLAWFGHKPLLPQAPPQVSVKFHTNGLIPRRGV
jgi:hypothetical protein